MTTIKLTFFIFFGVPQEEIFLVVNYLRPDIFKHDLLFNEKWFLKKKNHDDDVKSHKNICRKLSDALHWERKLSFMGFICGWRLTSFESVKSIVTHFDAPLTLIKYFCGHFQSFSEYQICQIWSAIKNRRLRTCIKDRNVILTAFSSSLYKCEITICNLRMKLVVLLLIIAVFYSKWCIN